jgi:23S rRNA (pseudouridine1915-N3)-methyltransferase
MNWRVVTVGKTSFSWVRQGVDTYHKRLARFVKVEVRALRDGRPESFTKALGDGPLICLDETGTLPSTMEVVDQVRAWDQGRYREATVCIGGAEGLPEELLRNADAVWSLGRMTLMHELALLVWMEQLYRVQTVLENHPYHREG